jgi:hypothetical protein
MWAWYPSTSPSALSVIWASRPKSTGLPSRPLTIGRAAGSWSETSRVAPGEVPPARRVRVWSMTLAVRVTPTVTGPASSCVARQWRP